MISIVVGTNRQNAVSKQIAQYYKNLFENEEIEAQVIDLELLPHDFTFSSLYQNSGKNQDFNALRQMVESSEKFVFIVPEYNGSFPGVLKAFIDGLSYPNALIHKKAALVGISDGVQGGALALSHLTDVFHYLGLHVLAQRVKIPFLKKNFVNGKLQDAFIEKLALEQVKLLITF